MKTKIIILTFSLLVVGFVNISFSYDHVRYVDIVNGDNANTGTSSGTAAWENLVYAVGQINSDNSILPGQSTILYVAPGTYSAAAGLAVEGNVVIRKNDLTIMGEDSATTILDGTGSDSAYWYEGIRTEDGVNNATITGMTVKNFTGAGVRFYSGTGNSVNACKLSGNTHGVSAYGAITESSSGIYNNIITGNALGIYLFSTNAPLFSEINGNSISMSTTAGIYIVTGDSESNPVIRGNTIFNNTSGIETVIGSAPSSPEILNNRLYDNANGIQLRTDAMTTSSPQIINNVIYKTTGTMTNGIMLYGGGTGSVLDAKIYHNTIDGGSDKGIYSDGESGSITADIKYCIITNFTGGPLSYGIDSRFDSTLNIDYVDVWNNATANFLNCDVTTINYDVDPIYAADYSLAVASPCIDAVPVSEADPVNSDIIGTSRPRKKDSAATSLHDLGAYEYPYKSYEFTMPGGTGLVTDYRLMTLPIELSSPSLTTILTDAYGTYDDRNWRVFAWDGSAYAEFGTASFDALLYAGRSFWLISLSGSLISDTNTFEGVLAGNMQPATILLTTGWNMIALPWPASTENPPVQLDKIVVKDGNKQFWLTSANNAITDPCVWDYNGVSGYTKLESATDLLVPEKGYWINVTSGSSVELVVPPDNGSHMTAAKRVTAKAGSSKYAESPPSPPGANLSAEGGNSCFIDTCFYFSE